MDTAATLIARDGRAALAPSDLINLPDMAIVIDREGFAWRSFLNADSDCLHLEAVPVELVADGTVVAWLCPACDKQLGADWKAPLSGAGHAAAALIAAGFDPGDVLSIGQVTGPAGIIWRRQ